MTIIIIKAVMKLTLQKAFQKNLQIKALVDCLDVSFLGLPVRNKHLARAHR